MRSQQETQLSLRCLLGSRKRFGAHGGGQGRGHTVAAAHLQLVSIVPQSPIGFNYFYVRLESIICKPLHYYAPPLIGGALSDVLSDV